MAFGRDDAAALLAEAFAPWVQALGIAVDGLEDGTARFRLPATEALVRQGGAGGGVVSGQAIASAADTCSVLALALINDGFRACTTVDLTCHFLRPLTGEGAIAVTALSNGRRMAVTRVEVRGPDGKLAAQATCAFAYLDG